MVRVVSLWAEGVLPVVVTVGSPCVQRIGKGARMMGRPAKADDLGRDAARGTGGLTLDHGLGVALGAECGRRKGASDGRLDARQGARCERAERRAEEHGDGRLARRKTAQTDCAANGGARQRSAWVASAYNGCFVDSRAVWAAEEAGAGGRVDAGEARRIEWATHDGTGTHAGTEGGG